LSDKTLPLFAVKPRFLLSGSFFVKGRIFPFLLFELLTALRLNVRVSP
jgi:hypothetical protein